ncbi:hypothetical protein C7212DRAFT_365483 [Tuber magnatum]|uniref:Uncharacterized protein n=1 Tax=Tuber magnatum TaxID=42249 RepID=A0A317SIB3_9PEZI|nr:hypothetical protein C7212DRAFT_365483 [Tuber magnatum]
MAIGNQVPVSLPPINPPPPQVNGPPPQTILPSPVGNPQHYGQTQAPNVILPMAPALQQPPSYSQDQAMKASPNVQVLLQPTGPADLEVYHAIATGETPARAPASIFVQNLYRTTQNNVFPVAEPTPATNSTDEVNKLTLTRRHPTRGSWSDACTTEIQPRLVLQAGITLVAIIQMRGQNYMSNTGQDRVTDRFDVTWNGDRGAFAIWRNDGQNVTMLFEVVSEGFASLDTYPTTGLLRAIPQDYPASQELGVLNFTAGSGQLIISHPSGYALSDVIAAAVLTVATVETRKSKIVQAAPQQQQQQQQQQAASGSYADQWQFKPAFAQTKETDEWCTGHYTAQVKKQPLLITTGSQKLVQHNSGDVLEHKPRITEDISYTIIYPGVIAEKRVTEAALWSPRSQMLTGAATIWRVQMTCILSGDSCGSSNSNRAKLRSPSRTPNRMSAVRGFCEVIARDSSTGTGLESNPHKLGARCFILVNKAKRKKKFVRGFDPWRRKAHAVNLVMEQLHTDGHFSVRGSDGSKKVRGLVKVGTTSIRSTFVAAKTMQQYQPPRENFANGSVLCYRYDTMHMLYEYTSTVLYDIMDTGTRVKYGY